jgi:nucleoside-triphosphatase
MNNVLLTGPPGVGKTTIIKKVINSITMKKGGFYTEEIRRDNKRVGFKIVSFLGEEEVLAHINSRSRYRVGKYGVNVKAFEKVGIPAILDAISNKDLIIIDELGRMELYSEEFQKIVIRALDSEKPLLGVIQLHRNYFLDSIRERRDVKIIKVNEKNRDGLPNLIIKEITC